MSPTPSTYPLVIAAATDAANRRMRRAGRQRWNRCDATVAIAAFHHLAAGRVPVLSIEQLDTLLGIKR